MVPFGAMATASCPDPDRYRLVSANVWVLYCCWAFPQLRMNEPPPGVTARSAGNSQLPREVGPFHIVTGLVATS
jgi:hypothetical protein